MIAGALEAIVTTSQFYLCNYMYVFDQESSIQCLLLHFVFISVALVISVPFALYHETAVDTENHLIYCQEAWPDETLGKVILVTVTGTNYVLPLTIILICYYQILRTMWEGYRRKVILNTCSSWSWSYGSMIYN
jgi:hypothetical protein